MKECTKCHLTKSLSDYYTSKGKIYSCCKQCHNVLNKKPSKKTVMYKGKLQSPKAIVLWESGVRTGKGNLKHGFCNTKFFRVYQGAKNRCNYPGHNRFHHYGGRGIKFLWTDFLSFKDDMYESYLTHVSEYGEKNTQIDRIDRDGNYCKENCRWATLIEQANNKSLNKFIEFQGRTQTIAEWAREYSIPMKTVWARLKLGWDISEALRQEKFRNNHEPYESY